MEVLASMLRPSTEKEPARYGTGKEMARIGGLMLYRQCAWRRGIRCLHLSEDSIQFGVGSPRSIVSTRFDLEEAGPSPSMEAMFK